ncbi:hypothetical protein [Ciceribacter sp. L1K22]|uniref:hypothetical protein n=1 Tax=Ciceribacter sp. L1K22 TaxID=2820275 RepID=UPI001ABEC4FA|nr:hypothetical protein [Ciceribacter sp. L1K22]MBO3760020.1 hypothetical protein [Ciceribacter sp. L1K22]
MVNETIADHTHTARRRLEIALDLFDKALVSSRTYSEAIEAVFDDAHFMAHEALAAVREVEEMAVAPVAD